VPSKSEMKHRRIFTCYGKIIINNHKNFFFYDFLEKILF
jgi:hypothetical protein